MNVAIASAITGMVEGAVVAVSMAALLAALTVGFKRRINPPADDPQRRSGLAAGTWTRGAGTVGLASGALMAAADLFRAATSGVALAAALAVLAIRSRQRRCVRDLDRAWHDSGRALRYTHFHSGLTDHSLQEAVG